jgi:hypothetical protein
VWENRKDGVMCKVDIIDYSVSGAFWEGQGIGGKGEREEYEEGEWKGEKMETDENEKLG